jgi:uncharacterized protein (DUF362 family)
MPTSSKKQRPNSAQLPVSVAIQESHKKNKFLLLEAVLRASDFWTTIELAQKASNIPPGEFRVLIKPDMEFFDVGAPTGTDPQLVEHLISLLAAAGYTNVSVADGVGGSSAWLENRDVIVLADLVGYRFATKDGHSYEFLNLSEDLVEAGFPPESTLHGSGLAMAWIEAHFRISMAKNKTDEENRYALGLQNLLGVLPLVEKDFHYYSRLQSPEVCVDLLRQTPVHFTIIDGFVSNHGGAGSRTVCPLKTHTMIASRELLLADWAGALKMGLDPYGSRLNAHALRTIGLPTEYRVAGDVIPYEGWNNVPLLVSDSVRKRNETPLIRRMAKPWLQVVNGELFPFKSPVDGQINAFLTKALADIDNHPLSYWATIALNYFLGSLHDVVEGWRVLYDKDKLHRKKVSLNIDLPAYSVEDYENIAGYMKTLATIAGQTAPDANGLRWRYIDNSVLFEYQRLLPIRYENFVSKVNICLSVQMMYDNIGGAYCPVRVDEKGRVIHQAERDIYLPQPNWMVLFGGQTIDVGKLELIQYGRSKQQIFWKTVTSTNKSADFDDGIVTFARHRGGTMVTIVARQKFTLPLFWQAVNMDFVPQVKDVLVSNSYTTFFSRTMANYEAAYEGRDPRIGQPWNETYGEAGGEATDLIAKQLQDFFSVVSGLIEQVVTRRKKS